MANPHGGYQRLLQAQQQRQESLSPLQKAIQSRRAQQPAQRNSHGYTAAEVAESQRKLEEYLAEQAQE